MSKVSSTPGRRRLYMEDDRVKVALPKQDAKFAIVSQYDTQTRKMQVKYEGEDAIDQNWILVKYVERVDEKGIPIPKPSRSSRSSSRGRDESNSRAGKKKAAVASRTRSKSRERQPTAAFSADEDATEPVTVQAKVKSPKKKTPTRTSTRKSEKEQLKDAEFSADEEEDAAAKDEPN